ncbi:hypothetical protein BD626DRAFT_586230 [Schizophyllum amplum]|uniref:F-box domain-containing protein n=1 Tax=Schizophyllum amplum TaxID=97359 RepID=A0A550C0C1_9AGAR|nr:hypothetical protein BD626DRAFT_586230 [Auriculariopsis ampla]
MRGPPPPRSTCLIHELSDELLATIHVLSIPEELTDPGPGSGKAFFAYMRRSKSLQYPHLLRRVCRRWHTLVTRNPILWSYIFVNAIDGDDHEYRPEQYELSLELSRDRPLALAFEVGGLSCRTILSTEPFARHVHRMRQLFINELDYSYQDPVLPLFPTTDTLALEAIRIHTVRSISEHGSYFRALKHSWRNGRAHQSKPVLRSAPRLTEFTLSGLRRNTECYSVYQIGRAGVQWSNLTVLRLPSIPRCAVDLFVVISCASRLRILRCTVFGEAECDELREEESYDVLSESEDDWSEDDDTSDDEEEEEDVSDRQDADDCIGSASGRSPTVDAYDRRARRERRRAEAERRAQEKEELKAKRMKKKEEFEQRQRALMGPHKLVDLEELHIDVGHDEDETSAYSSYTNFDGTNDTRTGTTKFLDGLIAPALTTLAISAHERLYRPPRLTESDYMSNGDIEEQEDGSGPFLLKPALKSFLKRSRCKVRHLSLGRLFISLPELLAIVKRCRHLHSLHLDRTLRFMRTSLVEGLTKRVGRKNRFIAPTLRHLVIESYEQNLYSGIRNSQILDMIDARWPPGWSDLSIAYVKVVHCPCSESGDKETSKDAAEARMRSRLASVQARKDVRLVISDIKRCAALQREIDSWGLDESDFL